jgi:hypothetical protein
MPLNIYLQEPYIVLTGSQSNWGITTAQQGFQVGSVYKIAMGSTWQTGTKVMFPTKDAIGISEGGDDYFMVDENEIFYYEQPIL